jgi:hypothetical protein
VDEQNRRTQAADPLEERAEDPFGELQLGPRLAAVGEDVAADEQRVGPFARDEIRQ